VIGLIASLLFFPMPCVLVAPSDDVQSIVWNAPEGTTFCFAPGTYRQTTIFPRSHQQFFGLGRAVLSGAKVLTSPLGSGPWAYTGQTQDNLTVTGECAQGEPRCLHAEDLFIDNVRQHHVDDPQKLRPGTWYFDYAHDIIYVGTDPAGRIVETSVNGFAFLDVFNATGVIIDGLIIEKYANVGNEAALHAQTGTRWLIDHTTVRLVHSVGVSVGTGSVIRASTFTHCGQAGIGSYAARDLLIEGNEVAFNGPLYLPYWGGAGIKLAAASYSTIRSNYVHDNDAFGIWCDVDCNQMIINNNVVHDSGYSGIMYEISFNAIIAMNDVRRSGWNTTYGIVQAGILVAGSTNVDVGWNLVLDNGWGVAGVQQLRGWSILYPGYAWELNNFVVHDNVMRLPAYGVVGMSIEVDDPSYLVSRGNRFARNTYYLQQPETSFLWGDYHMWDAWKNCGNDSAGSVTYHP
jgi:hypothetical protein